MKKIAFLIITLLISAISIHAEDTLNSDVITLKNGEEINVKVTEITPTEVKYKRSDNLEGPTITINRSDVFMIKYQNGTKEVIKSESATQSTANDESYSTRRQKYWTTQRPAGIGPFFDLGGFLFTGPRIGIEGRARRFGANLFFKIGSVGYMNKAYLDDNEMVNPAEDIKGRGIGYTVKWFFPMGSSNSAIHVGIINEWANYSCKFIDGEREIDWTRTIVGSTGWGGGYSYHAPGGFFTTIGGYWGVSAFNLEFTRPSTSHPYWIYTDNWATFFGIGEITLGYEFSKKAKK